VGDKIFDFCEERRIQKVRFYEQFTDFLERRIDTQYGRRGGEVSTWFFPEMQRAFLADGENEGRLHTLFEQFSTDPGYRPPKRTAPRRLKVISFTE